jgi:hypothetical protein
MMSLRAPITRDPFPFPSLARVDDTLAEHPARHARRRPRGEPLPGSMWALATLVAWSFAVLTTLLSVAIFGGLRNGLWLLAVVFYVAGIVSLLRSWGRQ